MNRHQDNHHPRLDDHQLDRLVDGELNNAERRALLLQLENEPDGWRRCALAFLEAQSWRAALTPATTLAPLSPIPAPDKQNVQHPSRRPLARLAALAVSLAAAFLLGQHWHNNPTLPAPPSGLATAEPTPPPPTPMQVAEQQPRPASLPSATAPLETVVKQWQQRGYHTETQKRVVSLELKGGRKVEVPVREVRLRAMGDRTY